MRPIGFNVIAQPTRIQNKPKFGIEIDLGDGEVPEILRATAKKIVKDPKASPKAKAQAEMVLGVDELNKSKEASGSDSSPPTEPKKRWWQK